MKALWARTTGLDRLIVAVLLLGILASFFLLGARPQGERVLVERGGRLLFSAPLAENRVVDLEGPLGITRLEIRDGQVRILASPCPTKACIGMGAIACAGEMLACVPNELLVRIEGAGKGAAHDLLSR
ncbi:NusG domain II-containing protein [Trichloromonas sp.]|uniref:NusG domain II-containing protein n=1 Tax=Trichloromonas sp. TaxID=3069249 RepID=UPI002A4CEB50|nr:NusG domain II-containing protein [Trichloromonas sp.]